MMMNQRSRHSLWMRTIAALVMCLFLVNSIAWAYPPTYTPSKATLAVSSIFKPILDVAGWQYQARIRTEMAFIISMALKGLKEGKIDYKSWINLNSALDKQYDKESDWPYDRRHRKLLEVISKPRELKNGDDTLVEIDLRTTRPSGNVHEFTVVFKGDKLEDMLDRSKIEITRVDVQTKELVISSGENAITDEHIRLLQDGEEILNKRIHEDVVDNDLVENDKIWQYKLFKSTSKDTNINSQDDVPSLEPIPRDEIKTNIIKLREVEQGASPKHVVNEHYLTIIETDHSYRIYIPVLAQCTGLALKGKRNGKNVLILGHLWPKEITLLYEIIDLLQSKEIGITDIHGILSTQCKTENSHNVKDKVRILNNHKNLDLKVRENRDESAQITDMLITQDGILIANYDWVASYLTRDAVTGSFFQPIDYYEPRNLEMYLWSDLTPEFDPNENPVNLLDVLNKEEKDALQFQQQRFVPIDAILARFAPVEEKEPAERAKELLFDWKHRPEPEEVRGISLEDVRKAEKEAFRTDNVDIYLNSKTFFELENYLPYLEKIVKHILENYSDHKIIIMGRDTETLYDALKTLLANTPKENDVMLFPGSGPFINKMNPGNEEKDTFTDDKLRGFLVSFGITKSEIEKGSKFLVLDTGFLGSYAHELKKAVSRLYDIPVSKVDNSFETKVIGLNPGAPKTAIIRQLMELNIDKKDLPKMFPKTVATVLSGKGMSQKYLRKIHLVGNFIIGAMMQLLPNYLGKYSRLERRKGSLVGIPERKSRITYNIDDAEKVDESIVNPVAAMLVQRRVVEYFRGVREKRDRFEEYLEKEGLAEYQALKKCFTPEVIEALLEDPALRPVFLQVLPNNVVGPLEINDQETLNKIGGTELLLSHSAFSVGKPEIADELVKKGVKIIVGVTDRWSEDTLYKKDDFIGHQVANGRQAYFPLSDGTWLGIKGAGQFSDDKKAPFYFHDRPGENMAQGLAWEREAKAAKEGTDLIKTTYGKNKGRFVEFLGYRRVYSLPDGKGGLTKTEGLEVPRHDFHNTALIFNRVMSPHRMVKFPQLLKTDPGLKTISKRVSRVLVSKGILPQGRELTPSEMMTMIMEEMGRSEAIKQNIGKFKRGVNWQDITLAGEEADNSEFCSAKELQEWISEKTEVRGGYDLMLDLMRSILEQDGLNVQGIAFKLAILTDMLNYVRNSGTNDLQSAKETLFPEPLSNLRDLFQTYFRTLDDQWLKLWVGNRELGHPLHLLEGMYSHILGVLDPEFWASEDTEPSLFSKNVADQIYKWAEEEWERRKAAEEKEPAEEGQRPELEPHQRDATEEVKTMLRNRLKGSPLESQIFEFLEKCDTKFITGKPKKLPEGFPAHMLKRPVCGWFAYKVNEDEVIEGIEWDNVYLDSEDFEKNYWEIIHEIVELAVILNLARAREFKDETMQELTNEDYTDAMTYLVMRHYADYFRFNRDEYLKVSYAFTCGLIEIMEDKSENIFPLLDNSVFSQELLSYFRITAACLETSESMQQMGDFDFDGVLEKFDYNKENGGLTEKEQEVALSVPDNFISIINKCLAENGKIGEFFPTLSAFTPSLYAISPEEIKIPALHNFLNRASRYLDDYPVDTTIPLSLIPKADIDANMRTWAYLILLHNKYKLDVNYIFESKDDKEYEQSAIQLLMTHIMKIASLTRMDINIDEVRKRINKRHADPRTIEIRIMKLEDLEKMRTLPANVLPIAMSEGQTQFGVPVRDFASATAIGLAQAACKKLKMENDENLPEFIEYILPRLQKIYKKLFPNEDIKEIVTKQTVLNMIDENPTVRKNLAISLALPPIVRVAIQHLRHYHERLHLLLKAA